MKRFAASTLVFILATSSVWAGTYYKTRSVSYDGTRETVNESEVWVEGDQGKVQSDLPPYGPRVLITNDGGQTVYVINPTEKTYSKHEVQGLISMISALSSGMGSAMSFSFTDQKSKILAREPGPEILGMPTTHIRSQVSYSMHIKVLGMTRTSRVEVITDHWITTAVKAASPFFYKLMIRDTPFASALGSTELEALLKEGLILKRESNQKTIQLKKNGAVKSTNSSRSTLEITELDVDFDIPEGTFEIPFEYTLVESTLAAPEDNPLKGIFNRR